MLIPVLYFSAGAVLLYIGAEGLVRGAVHLANLFRIKPFIIGLTVVAFGTSTPEFVVSLISALAGNSDIALGNVVGSNITNITLILGIAAVILPIDVDRSDILIHYPVMLGSSILLFLLSLGSSIGMLPGIILLSCIFIYTALLLMRTERQVERAVGEPVSRPVSFPGKKSTVLVSAVFVAGGSFLLMYGSELIVDSGMVIARAVGVPDFVIGVTLVALGTSLPELATTVVAVIKKDTAMCLGNIIGSNIFNALFVIGGVAVITPIGVAASSASFEFPVMLGFSVFLFVIMRTGLRISRFEAALLLCGYILFILILFQREMS